MNKLLTAQLQIERQLLKAIQNKIPLAAEKLGRPIEAGELIQIYLWYALMNNDLAIKRYQQVLESKSTLDIID